MIKTRKRREVTVIDNSALASRIGERIRRARHKAGLTQSELAKGRYTSAYISSLERGHAKPSMAALSFIAERLAVPVREFLDENTASADRLAADLHLALGDWEQALDLFTTLAERSDGPRARAEALKGQAEALLRMERPREALAPAAEAVQLLREQGRKADVAEAAYWLAYAHARSDNLNEARDLLREALTEVRSGLKVLPDFQFRLLSALANVEALDGRHEQALAYLEEARALAGDLDTRRHASFLAGLALSYRNVGDFEASVTTGLQALGLFRDMQAAREAVALENSLALTYLHLGNLEMASRLVEQAVVAGRQIGAAIQLAHALDTSAQVAMARGDLRSAATAADEAVRTGEECGSAAALAEALATRASLPDRSGPDARRDFEQATALLADSGYRARTRELYGRWAEFERNAGDLTRATELYQRALDAGRS